MQLTTSRPGDFSLIYPKKKKKTIKKTKKQKQKQKQKKTKKKKWKKNRVALICFHFCILLVQSKHNNIKATLCIAQCLQLFVLL